MELQYDNGECDQVDLDKEAGFQDHRLSGPETTVLRITVLDAAPPTESVGVEEPRRFRRGPDLPRPLGPRARQPVGGPLTGGGPSGRNGPGA